MDMEVNEFHGVLLIKQAVEKPGIISFAELVDAWREVGSDDTDQKPL
jgi:hypothetical protein